MNKKYEYKHTMNEDFNVPDNNYGVETDYIVCEPPYDFFDFLCDNNVPFEYDDISDTFYVIDDEGNRTGEVFLIINISDTDEQLCC